MHKAMRRASGSPSLLIKVKGKVVPVLF